MKKILSSVIAGFVATTFMWIAMLGHGYAHESPVLYASEGTYTAGQEFSVRVYMSGLSQAAADVASVTIKYDPALLQYVRTTDASDLPMPFGEPTTKDQSVTINRFSMAPVAATATPFLLTTVAFKAVSVGKAKLSLNSSVHTIFYVDGKKKDAWNNFSATAKYNLLAPPAETPADPPVVPAPAPLPAPASASPSATPDAPKATPLATATPTKVSSAASFDLLQQSMPIQVLTASVLGKKTTSQPRVITDGRAVIFATPINSHGTTPSTLAMLLSISALGGVVTFVYRAGKPNSVS